MRLDERDIETLARRIVQLLDQPTSPAPAKLPGPVRLLTAAQLAAALGVRRDWVYRNAAQLGVVRLGGPAGRLRFDLQHARTMLAEAPAEVSQRPTARRRGGGAAGLDSAGASSYRRRDRKPEGRATLTRPRP